jgi:fatty-acyl-CoA synthase
VCPESERSGFGELRAARLPELQRLIFLGANPPHPSTQTAVAVPPGMLGWEELLQMGDGVPIEQLREREASLDFDDPANIQYTSGTTGMPKGATLSHHNIVNNGMLTANAMRFTHRDRLCIPVPFYHCFGTVLSNVACVTTGATMVVPAPYFDAEATLQAIAEERCTALHGVPTMFIAELEHPQFAKFDLSSLRTGMMAGSPCPIEIMKRVVQQMHCGEMTIAYGLTEASPVITQTTTDDPIELRVTTVGKVLPHTEAKIVNPLDGRTVALGEHGELCTRGYHVMKGYYNNASATRAVIDADGWLHTGDLAVLDENGYFKITGRAKDVIIRGGENISPREIEEFLYSCPGISAVQVIGVPDRKYGEQVAAWIRLERGSALTEDDVRRFCEGRIARFKIPRYIKFVEEFPLTVTGKMQKFKMREIAIKELGLEDEARIETA